jgi:hypothetical protein
MSLTAAFKNRTTSFVQAQNAYQINVATVSSAMVAVSATNLPPLTNTPPDWADFVTANATAKSMALVWLNSVYAQLESAPSNVQSYNANITALLTDARNQAQALVANPADASALALLQTDCNNLTSTINLVATFVTSTLSQVQKFNNTLPDLAATMTSIALKSGHDASVDQASIDTLRAAIQQLNSDITSLTASMVGLGIAAGAALILGTVASIAAFPVGLVTWLFLAPVVAVAIYEMVMDANQIKEDQQTINADQDKITGLTADIAALQLLADTYTNLANQTTSLQTNLQAIVVEWQTLASDISTAASDVQQALADAGSTNFGAVLTDIDGALAEWVAAYNQAGSLFVPALVSNASLQLGMSSDDLKTALANGQNISLVTYCNQQLAA